MIRLCLLLLAALAPAAPCPATHDGIHEQLERITAVIASDPAVAGPYLQRAELHRLHGDLAACGADLERVRALAPELPGLLLGRARLARAAGRLSSALNLVEQRLARADGSPGLHLAALRLRAELLQQKGANAAAVRAWTALLEAHPQPKPDWFLARAALQPPEPALAGIEVGLKRLGNAASLLLAASELEEELERPHAACARLQVLVDGSRRKETWLARQGDVLHRAGLDRAATAKFRQAAEAWQRLPSRHRRTPAMRRLGAHLEARLKEAKQRSES